MTHTAEAQSAPNCTIATQLAHRTIREFTAEPVPEETVSQLLDVAMHTATSRGLQQAGIIRVTDAQLREQLTKVGLQDYVLHAPVYLVFIIDTARNAAILRQAGASEEDIQTIAGNAKVFFEGFTDACLMAQNVATAVESLGLGVNYLGNIHNDTARVIDLLNLPKYTFPVVAMTLGWPNQKPQLKPRIPTNLRVMDNSYAPAPNWTAALSEYDQLMRTYYDLRDANRRVDSFSDQVINKMKVLVGPRDQQVVAARAQGFDL